MASGPSLNVQLVGLQEALKGLDGFNKAVRYRVTRDAVNAGAGVLRDGAKRNAPTETKTLKNNLIVKTFVPKDDRGIYCRIGARRKVKKAVRPNARGVMRTLGGKKLADATAAGEKIKYRSPSRYIHLAEKGTKPHPVIAKNSPILSSGGKVFGYRVTVSAKPRPFLSFTVRSLGSTASAKAVAKLKKGIALECRKAAAKAAVKAVARSDRK